MRFLLDGDVSPRVAEVCRGRGMDVGSVHRLDRLGLDDAAQLRYAAGENLVFVTRSRDDFRELTVRSFEAREPHAGVLIVPWSIPNHPPARLASALEAYEDSFPGDRLAPYTIDFLRRRDAG